MAVFRRSKTRLRGSRTLTIPDSISSHDRSGSNIWSRGSSTMTIARWALLVRVPTRAVRPPGADNAIVPDMP